MASIPSRPPYSADEAAYQELKKSDRVIAFRQVYATITDDPLAGLMLSQMRFLSEKIEPDENGHRWFALTRKDWWDDTRMGRREQESARNRLIELGFICEAQGEPGGPNFFRVVYAQVLRAQHAAPLPRDWDVKRPSPGWEPVTPVRKRPTPGTKQPDPPPVRNSPTPRYETYRPPVRNVPTPGTKTPDPPNRDLRVLEKSRETLSPLTPSTGQEGEREEIHLGTSKRQFPPPDDGPLDLPNLARKVWCAYPKNAHLRPAQVLTNQVSLLLGIFRDDAAEGKTTRSDVAVEILSRIEALADDIRAAPDCEWWLPAPEKFFRERGWQKDLKIYTRKGNVNGIAQKRTLQSITEATLHRYATPETGAS